MDWTLFLWGAAAAISITFIVGVTIEILWSWASGEYDDEWRE